MTMDIKGEDLISLIRYTVAEPEDRIERMVSWKRDTLSLIFNLFATALIAVAAGLLLGLLTGEIDQNASLGVLIFMLSGMLLLFASIVALYIRISRIKDEYISAFELYRMFATFYGK